MPAKQDLKRVKSSIEVAQKMASQVNAWAEKATKLAESGKELSEIQDVLKGVTAFGKASAFLGVAAGGMELVLMLVGGPTPEEQIMSMIGKLSNKVDRLGQHLDYEFERLEDHDDLVNAKNLINKHNNKIRDVLSWIDEYRNAEDEHAKIGIQKTLLEGDLYYQSQYLDCVRHMADLLNNSSADQNILLATFNSTCGDLKAITTIGMPYLMSAIYASMAYSLLAALRFQRNSDDGLQTPEEIEELFQPYINKISEAIKSYSQKCYDEAEQRIEERVEKDEIFKELDVSDYNDAASVVIDQLYKQWYWYDWLVIVYAPVEGWDNHGVIAGTHLIHKKMQPCKKEEANIIISWTPKNGPKIPQDLNDKVAKMIFENYSHSEQLFANGDAVSKVGPLLTAGVLFEDTRGYLNAFTKLNPGNTLFFLLQSGWQFGAQARMRMPIFGPTLPRDIGRGCDIWPIQDREHQKKFQIGHLKAHDFGWLLWPK